MKYLILVIVLLISASAFALPTCSKNGTRIIYTNGVLTPRDEADEALFRILSLKDSKGFRVTSSIDQTGIKDPIVAYNYTEGPAKDFLEAAVQRLPKSYLDTLHVTNAYDAYSHLIQGDLIEIISTDITNSINDARLQIILTLTQGYFNSSLYDQTINEGVPLYLGAFQRKEKIFAISHSQGSLFMRDFYNLIPESDYKRKFFSGFQVASVLGSPMNSHFGYATNSKDEVVNGVRLAIGALPANLDTPFIISTDGYSDLFVNHGILTTYLYDPSLKSQVIENLIEAAELMESNCNKAEIKMTEKNGLKVSFDSTDPEDKDVSDLTYEWNFGEGQLVQTKSKTISHTFSKSGLYTISLKVINNDGDIDSKNIVVQVLAPPKAVINYTKNNLQVNFDSTDPQDPNAANLTYSWSFGDGQKSNTASKILSHNYSLAGTYVVTLTVTDAYGVSSTSSASVTVQNLAANLMICNGGKVPITMSFSSPTIPSFNLEHINHYSTDEYGNMTYINSTCECKSVSIPQGKQVGIHVEGSGLPDWLQPDGILPYDGYVTAQSSIQYFTVGTKIENNLLYYVMVKGSGYGVECQDYIYK